MRNWLKLVLRGVRLRSLLLPLFLLCCCLNWPASALAFPRSLFIDQARQQPDGAEVVVTGNVTVPCGAFGSSNLDEGFVIQDLTGGIYVSTDRPLDLKLGEAVEVDGTLQDDGHGQRMLMLGQWQRSDRPLPRIVPKLASAQEAGKSLDGQLVTVHGTIVQPLQDDAPYGDRLWIEDETGAIQIYIPKSTQIAPQELSFLQPGQTIQVTGFSSQFDESDEVVPRSREDIAEFGVRN